MLAQVEALDIDAIERDFQERGIATVVCALSDIWGRLVGKRLTVDYFLDALRAGHGVSASIYLFTTDMEMDPRPGYKLTGWDKGFQDFVLQPDMATLRFPPWQKGTAVVLCDATDPVTGELVPVAPRSILKRQLARAKRLGLEFKCATELEFFTFRDSYDQAWEKRYRDLTPTSRYRADYHILQSSRDEPFVGELRDMMLRAGIEVENAKTEWGLGQQEIALKYTDPLEMADRHVLYKTWVKELLGERGLSATFMAKPFAEEVGSSCHVHVSMWDGEGRAIGHDPSHPSGMTPRFGAFVAGMMAGGADYCWFYAPGINSYKRFKKSSFAPVQLVVGNDNRTCGFRLIGQGRGFRVENRIPGADANPYLALAGVLASGLDGVEAALPIPAIYDANAYEDPSLPRVPVTMHEAVRRFSRAESVRSAIGEAVHDHLVTFAEDELAAFEQEAVTDWELVRYFERV